MPVRSAPAASTQSRKTSSAMIELLIAEDTGGAGDLEDPDRVGARQVPQTRRDAAGHAWRVVVAPTARAAAAWREVDR